MGIKCIYRPPMDFMLRVEAERGDAEAQFELGCLYLDGNPGGHEGVSFHPSVSQNLEEAIAWLQKARDQGHPKAQEFLDVALRRADGVP